MILQYYFYNANGNMIILMDHSMNDKAGKLVSSNILDKETFKDAVIWEGWQPRDDSGLCHLAQDHQ